MSEHYTKARVREAVVRALKEEFNLTFATDTDALRAICEMDSLDKIELVMEIEYSLDANIDLDWLDANLSTTDADQALEQLTKSFR